jgi:hypothetical protein
MKNMYKAPTSSQKRNILVIRSAGLTFNRAIKYIDSRFPEATIQCLVTPNAREHCGHNAKIDKLHVLSNNKLSLKTISESLIKTLQSQNFDEIYILYKYTNYYSYWNVEQLGMYLKSNIVKGLDADLNEYKYTPIKLKYREFIGRIQKLFLSLINSISCMVCSFLGKIIHTIVK